SSRTANVRSSPCTTTATGSRSRRCSWARRPLLKDTSRLWSSNASRPGAVREARELGREVVREARELLGAVLGHDEQILEPAAAEPGPVETGLDREDLAALQLFVPDHAEHGQLVHLEADAVAERMEEALLERLPLALRALRRLAGRLEDLAAALVDGLAGDTRAQVLLGPVERLLAEAMPLHQLVGH